MPKKNITLDARQKNDLTMHAYKLREIAQYLIDSSYFNPDLSINEVINALMKLEAQAKQLMNSYKELVK